jgi:hypothetical protein
MERVHIIEGSPVRVKAMRSSSGIEDFDSLPSRKESSERVESDGIAGALEFTPVVSPSFKDSAMLLE